MSLVKLKVSRELLEQMLALGDRRIVGVRFEPTEHYVEPTALLVFDIEAPDAPDGAVEMEPTLRRSVNGTVTMADPGWVVR